MPAPSRRIFVYWLLLLVPALAAGVGALYLLRKEQQRLDDQARAVAALRRETIAARTSQIAESVELAIGDVQQGLMTTLNDEVTAENPDAVLGTLPTFNPLVKSTFRLNGNDGVLRPASGPERAWIEAWLAAGKPWRGTFKPAKDVVTENAVRKEAAPNNLTPSNLTPSNATTSKGGPNENKVAAKKDAALEVLALSDLALNNATLNNVAQNRSVRSQLQETARQSSNSIYSGNLATGAEAPAARRDSAAPVTTAPTNQAKSQAAPMIPAVTREAETSLDRGSAARDATVPVQQKMRATPESNGWVSWKGAGGLHMIGWRRPSFGGTLGVEVNFDALVSRLNELLPRDGDMANSFAITAGAVPARWLSGGGRELFSSSRFVSKGASPDVIAIPLSATSLPGWSVVGLVGEGPESGGGGQTFFWVGSLLVGALIVTILAGGTLLLRDARRSEAEAAQKTSFVANVSHEFKTPLTTIRLYAELLEQGRVRDEAQGGDYLRTIARETQRLARLVNNALDFSRLEQGQKKFTRETLDLTAEISRLLDAHEPRLVDAGLTMKRGLPATAMIVTSDRDALEQVVLNLLDNACKYAAEGGEVTVQVTVGEGGSGAEIHVLDRGPGVPEEHRERIFEKFHRVDDTLTAEKSGAGLGLSIARQLARGLGGELRYAPRAHGGAEFILSLP